MAVPSISKQFREISWRRIGYRVFFVLNLLSALYIAPLMFVVLLLGGSQGLLSLVMKDPEGASFGFALLYNLITACWLAFKRHHRPIHFLWSISAVLFVAMSFYIMLQDDDDRPICDPMNMAACPNPYPER